MNFLSPRPDGIYTDTYLLGVSFLGGIFQLPYFSVIFPPNSTSYKMVPALLSLHASFIFLMGFLSPRPDGIYIDTYRIFRDNCWSLLYKADSFYRHLWGFYRHTRWYDTYRILRDNCCSFLYRADGFNRHLWVFYHRDQMVFI